MVAAAAGIAASRGSRVWDKAYEFRAVTLMALGLGVVGLDRFIINPLFPVMQKDLGLSYQDLGLITAVLALTWGVAAVLAGQIADRFGHKPVMTFSMLAFSILVASTGLATGLLSLILIRAVMGFAEGSFLPASIVTTVEASKPSRIGLNVGIQQMAQPLVGAGFGPIIAVGLLKALPSWHWVFAAAAVPGLIVAAFIALAIRHDPPHSKFDHTTEKSVGFLHALGNRNVIFAVCAMCCFLTALITIGAFAPNYLTDHLKLSIDQMGLVLSGQGIGSLVGMVGIPMISDRLGHRKATMLGALVLAFASLVALIPAGPNPVLLFVLLFLAMGGIAGAVAINVGPLLNASVPPAIAATATGLVVGIGEIVGGAGAPALAGALADTMGISIILKIAAIGVALGFVAIALGVREPKRA